MKTSNYPLITIGVPTRNRASLLMDCVASALAQSYQNIEVLVSDNASTDGTVAALRSIDDARLRVLRNSENIGHLRNWARCVREAKGDYIVLASDDNLFEPSFLEKCVRLVNMEPDIPIVLAAYDTLVLDEFAKDERRIVPANLSKKFSTGIWHGTDILAEYLHGRLSAQLLSSIIRTDLLRANSYSTHACAFDEATWIPVLLEGRVGLVNEKCATSLAHNSTLSAAFSADDRFFDLCKVMEEISVLAEHKIANHARRRRIQILTLRYMAYYSMNTLVLYRRAGASVADAIRKLWSWRSVLKRCTLPDFVTTLRLRTLGRIVVPEPMIRWSLRRQLDRFL
jgi:glycosyltransferase involved in cell wall biosynthesis